MAILYGTLPNGSLVPVEADAQGRLVAELAGGSNTYLDSGGWQGGSPLGIAQQYVTSGTSCTFAVLPIALIEGLWLVSASIYADLSPNRPSSGPCQFQITFPQLEVQGNILSTSKPDGLVFRAFSNFDSSVNSSHVEFSATAFVQCSGPVTLDQVGGSFFAGTGPHDLKVNCWYTAVRIA